MTGDRRHNPPQFDDAFRARLRELVFWRRDVRRFRPEPIDDALLSELIALASRAPSVGYSQPWRFVLVECPKRRAQVRASFERANADALASYGEDRRGLYARLKLEGLDVAPVHLAVFADEATDAGAGLGSRTMPETMRYSVVGAVQTLWLAARAHGLGVGWISILEPDVVSAALDVPATWRLVAYLCIGWPAEEHLDPELERSGWQDRVDVSGLIVKR
ncbi:5,6-dimethylbenzimidazole synthase [Hyphomicrobium sp. D-2]|uniref:5,6-dimethylbenzimidazole synthase n=1 Tax=Hyphomicrobium sp. D-2 TaxID=3041621 RepID=UPI0024589849|nr:5,6-dimethylbenzimidazole synthase [Hyphomicrobium sp. D-2]MDH4981922.1 5,6-dimethylbenzimidazole synthase [Hyphomicrobium sp. D-2]